MNLVKRVQFLDTIQIQFTSGFIKNIKFFEIDGKYITKKNE